MTTIQAAWGACWLALAIGSTAPVTAETAPGTAATAAAEALGFEARFVFPAPQTDQQEAGTRRRPAP